MADKVQCPKCGSKFTYIDDGQNACKYCGERWPINGAAPIVYKKLSEEDILMSEKRVCANCERPKPIIGRGLCGGCYYAARKAGEPGSPEYIKALAEAKKRFTDPDYKSGRGGNRRTKKLSPEKIKQHVCHSRAGGNPEKKVMPFFPHKDPDKTDRKSVV